MAVVTSDFPGSFTMVSKPAKGPAITTKWMVMKMMMWCDVRWCDGDDELLAIIFHWKGCEGEKRTKLISKELRWVTANKGMMISPGRYVLKIHFFIESGLKMIQFKIQFKTKSKIFIQKNIHSIESRIFNRIIHSQKMRKIIQNSKMRLKYGLRLVQL